MPARVAGWLAGFLAGVLAAALLPEDLFPGVRAVAFSALFLGCGLAGEVVQLVREPSERGAERRPRDTRPADGLVEILALPDASRVPNPHDPRYGRFVAFPPGTRARVSPRAGADGENPLLGRVAVCSLYVGLDGRPWTDEELARSQDAVMRGVNWIEKEAARWGAAVNLAVPECYFVTEDAVEDEVAVAFGAEGGDVGPMEEGAETKALLVTTRAAVRLGFRDAADLVGSVASRLGADATVWLLHLRRAGRSLAVPPDLSPLPGVDLAVCYCREASFPEPLTGPARTDPVTVVHELLHLFGATDKYNVSLREFEPRSVTSREVMRLSETRLSRLRIDPRTAREIGWGEGAGAPAPVPPG